MKKYLTVFVSLLLCVLCVSGLNAEEKWNQSKSIHFIVYYKDAPEAFVENVKESAEDYYKEVSRNLGFTRYESWTYEDRAKIYIYKDQEEFVTQGNQAKWSHGVASFREKTIRTFPSAHGFFDTTLPHELGHIIFRENVGYKASIPLWVDEGVAMFQEKAQRWGANKIVRQAMKEGVFLSLDELSKMRLYRDTPRKTIELFYAEAASIVYYLIEEMGKYRFVQFCENLKSGESFEEALFDAYSKFDSLEGLNKAWTRYVERD